MEDQKNSINERLKKGINFHARVSLLILFGILWIASIIMFATIAAGVLKISYGIFIEFKEISHIQNEGILEILHGLELIFLSPLIYFLILAFAKYFSIIKPEINKDIKDLQEKRERLKHVIHEINYVKLLTISLFLSLLVLHSISLVIRNEFTPNGMNIIFMISILLVLIIYYYVLDTITEKLRKKID